MRVRFLAVLAALAVATPAFASPALAADFEIAIKDHRFVPDRVEIPANEKVTLIVRNQDPTAEEFESKELKREKIVAGGKEAKIIVGPLKPGEYKFFGEYHEDTAQGVLVVK